MSLVIYEFDGDYSKEVMFCTFKLSDDPSRESDIRSGCRWEREKTLSGSYSHQFERSVKAIEGIRSKRQVKMKSGFNLYIKGRKITGRFRNGI